MKSAQPWHENQKGDYNKEKSQNKLSRYHAFKQHVTKPNAKIHKNYNTSWPIKAFLFFSEDKFGLTFEKSLQFITLIGKEGENVYGHYNTCKKWLNYSTFTVPKVDWIPVC